MRAGRLLEEVVGEEVRLEEGGAGWLDNARHWETSVAQHGESSSRPAASPHQDQALPLLLAKHLNSSFRI